MKIITTILAMLTLAVCPARNEKTDEMKTKVLVAYYSATGTTKAQAEAIAEATGAKLYEITPAVKYSAADLDWRDSQSRSTIEMHNDNSRPELGGEAIDAAAYDIIFIGFPNWWNLPPRIINSWIESQNLAGKTVIPFSTSGGSGIGNSVQYLRKLYPVVKWKDGKMLNCPAKDAAKWAKEAVDDGE